MANRLTDRVVLGTRAVIADRLLHCLEPDERAAVEGDLAELQVPARDAVGELFGLVVRRQVIAWRDWRAWIGLVAALPLGMMLSVVSRAWAHGTAIYAWLYLDNWTPEYLNSPGARADLLWTISGFGLHCTALVVWACTVGSAIRLLAPRARVITFAIIAALVFYGTAGSATVAVRNPANAIVFAHPMYRDGLPAAFRLVLIVAPLVFTLWSGDRRSIPTVGRAAGVLIVAIIVTVLVSRGAVTAATFGWWSLSRDSPMFDPIWRFRRAWQSWLLPLMMVAPALYVFFNSSWRSRQGRSSAS